MAKKRQSPMETDDTSIVTESAQALSSVFSIHRERGNVSELQKLLDLLGRTLNLDIPDCNRYIEQTIQRQHELTQSFGKTLKVLCDQGSIDFEYKPPAISIGCIRVKHEHDGRYQLTSMDGYMIESINTFAPAPLVDAALQHIAAIESEQEKIKQFAKNIRIAYDMVRKDDSGYVSANILMILCSSGINTKKVLESAEQLSTVSGLSRNQFGYMLSAMRRLHDEFKLDFSGATQSESLPHQFISVPENPDPRRLSESRRVVSIRLHT